MEGLLGDYDALANNLSFMSTHHGKPMRHIVYQKSEGDSYRAIATIDAMPNLNLAVTWMRGENSWHIVQRRGSERTQHLFTGDRQSFFTFMQGLCEELEA